MGGPRPHFRVNYRLRDLHAAMRRGTLPSVDDLAGGRSSTFYGDDVAMVLRERGITTVGPHRADVILRLKGRSARETLSRGQQKLTAVAMIVAQMKLLRAELNTQAVLLLDDPAAELDAKNLARLFEELTSLQCQMIATSLTPETTLFQAPKATFHVEQGRVKRV